MYRKDGEPLTPRRTTAELFSDYMYVGRNIPFTNK